MAKSRLQLHERLCEILGSRNCYFSPPPNTQMSYPCIVYELSNIQQTFADNITYQKSRRYSVTVIDEDPDSEIPDRIIDGSDLYTTSDRNFVNDGLYHFTFTIFY